mmetsp:Transcript_9316/g.13980  ORF Transcript_9316/g.13980 Transcript_9316/m.13980 type:complete len:222 (-) Transcript_9316:164-829(-)
MYHPVPAEDTGENKDKNEASETIQLNLFQVGKSKRQVEASPSWTVSKFKEKVFPDEVKDGKNVRLIFQGKLLTDDMSLKASGLQEGSFVHCSICNFNNAVVNNPQDDNHNANHGALQRDLEEAQIPPWLLHAQFTRQGTTGDFILGFIMGFFLGVLTLIWVWQRAVPRRQKLGIMLGFGCNLLLSFIQVANQQHDGSTTTPSTTPHDPNPDLPHPSSSLRD